MSVTLTRPDPSFHPRPLPFPLENATLYAAKVGHPTQLDLFVEELAEHGCKPENTIYGETYQAKTREAWPPVTVHKVALVFQDERQAEKALAIHRGLMFDYPISPPSLSPFCDDQLPLSYVRPRDLIPCGTEAGSAQTWPTPFSQIPKLGHLWDIIRPWGAIYQLIVHSQPIPYEEEDEDASLNGEDYYSDEESEDEDHDCDDELCTWKIGVTFCNEADAQHFEDSVAHAGGWHSYVQQDILWHPPIPVVDGKVPEGFMEARKLAIKRYRDEENEIPKRVRRRTSRGGNSYN